MTEQPAPRRRRRWWLWGIGGVVAVVAVIGALVFQPWLLFIDVRVDDAIPAPATSVSAPTATPAADEPAHEEPAADVTPSAPAEPAPPAGPVDLLTGTFVSHEHATTGTARVIQLPDGSRQLAIENLDTSNGPDVHVWLSAGPVVEGFDGWFTASGHPFVDLGPIKGNQGNQLYDIPADVDLTASAPSICGACSSRCRSGRPRWADADATRIGGIRVRR